MMDKNITPIFIIGASRNGTTSLENMISRFPEVATIEHELHHGSHEAKLYGYYKFYGDITSPDKYIDFLYHYSTEDYFALTNGNVEFHLNKPQPNFFEFFFDMIDRYCQENQKQYWTAKLDSAFFTDDATFKLFLETLYRRYRDVKFIRIQRDFMPALLSAQNMEGRNYSKRQNGLYKYYHLLGYTQSWFKAYLFKIDLLKKEGILHIDFDDFIQNKQKAQNEIRTYMGLPEKFQLQEMPAYAINTSFSKSKNRKISFLDKYIASTYLQFLKLFPSFVSLGRYINHSFLNKKPVNPLHRKILKQQFFGESLRKEFEEQGAHGLINKVK